MGMEMEIGMGLGLGMGMGMWMGMWMGMEMGMGTGMGMRMRMGVTAVKGYCRWICHSCRTGIYRANTFIQVVLELKGNPTAHIKAIYF